MRDSFCHFFVFVIGLITLRHEWEYSHVSFANFLLFCSLRPLEKTKVWRMLGPERAAVMRHAHIRPSVIDLQIVVNAPPYTRLSLSVSLSPLWWPLLLRCRYRSSGACGGFAKEDIYENLPWSPSKKSLKDMKERAAIQCMKKTQWDCDTEAKYQSICAYVREKEAGLLLLCGATTHKNLRGKLCFSFGRHAEVDIEATLSTVDALKALSEAPVSSKFLFFFLTGAQVCSVWDFFFLTGKKKKKTLLQRLQLILLHFSGVICHYLWFERLIFFHPLHWWNPSSGFRWEFILCW